MKKGFVLFGVVFAAMAMIGCVGDSVFDDDSASEQMYCPADFEMLGAELSGAGSTSGTLSILLGNKVGNHITITSVTITGDVSGSSTDLSIDAAPGAQIPTITVTVSDMSAYSPGDMVDMHVIIEYTDNALNMTGNRICDVRKRVS